eukprot:scaffold119473_cov36-Phaeocystis_antarctica.AAC.1
MGWSVTAVTDCPAVEQASSRPCNRWGYLWSLVSAVTDCPRCALSQTQQHMQRRGALAEGALGCVRDFDLLRFLGKGSFGAL